MRISQIVNSTAIAPKSSLASRFAFSAPDHSTSRGAFWLTARSQESGPVSPKEGAWARGATADPRPERVSTNDARMSDELACGMWAGFGLESRHGQSNCQASGQLRAWTMARIGVSIPDSPWGWPAAEMIDTVAENPSPAQVPMNTGEAQAVGVVGRKPSAGSLVRCDTGLDGMPRPAASHVKWPIHPGCAMF